MASSPLEPLYREVPLHPELRPYAEAAWLLVVPNVPPPLPHRVLPDGCMDIVGTIGGALVVAGPSTGPELGSLVPGGANYGIRFRPGMGEAVFGLPATDLRDGGASLDGVWSPREMHAFRSTVDTDDPEVALTRLQRALGRAVAAEPAGDPVVLETIALIDGRETASVAGLGAALGVSDRQLRRRFDRAVGYGPKQLARILRFQRALAVAQGRQRAGAEVRWADVAATVGYADQSHLVHEWNDLAGLPPGELLASRPRFAA